MAYMSRSVGVNTVPSTSISGRERCAPGLRQAGELEEFDGGAPGECDGGDRERTQARCERDDEQVDADGVQDVSRGIRREAVRERGVHEEAGGHRDGTDRHAVSRRREGLGIVSSLRQDRIMATLEDIARELYAVPPAEFTAARGARVAEVKADDPSLARAIGTLKRASVPAWVVGQLVRHRADDIERALALAVEMRDAQDELDAPALAELTTARRRLTAALAREGAALAAPEGRRRLDGGAGRGLADAPGGDDG